MNRFIWRTRISCQRKDWPVDWNICGSSKPKKKGICFTSGWMDSFSNRWNGYCIGGKMKGIFNPESPFIQFLDAATDLVILNVLCILCCIPVFTIGASLSALHFVLMKMVKREDSNNIRTFFSAFQQNFKQSTLLWIGFLIISAIHGRHIWGI